jgi:tRNA-specific 2-thiouridylase
MVKEKIVVAMSGGIDSSMAAHLLCQSGYEVVGVTMRLFDESGAGPDNGRPTSCCSPGHYQDAREVAAALGIRHYMVNYRDDFRQRVIAPFVETYLKGLTPSPCILCNSLIKFDKLRRFAHCLGIRRIATGHYAATQFDDITSRHLLLRGRDSQKDQSYFLFDLEQDQLREVVFPLGGLTKRAVRELAATAGLPVAEKPESQEICFVPDGDYAGFINRYVDPERRAAPSPPGDIVLTDSTVVGRHEGIHHYTVGQRRGLGVALGYPAYVVGLRPAQNQVVVGRLDDIYARRFRITRCNWIAIPALDDAIEAEVKIRSRFQPAAAEVRPCGEGGAVVVFREPQAAITPGQAAVFYWDDVVVGGGWIYRIDPEPA